MRRTCQYTEAAFLWKQDHVHARRLHCNSLHLRLALPAGQDAHNVDCPKIRICLILKSHALGKIFLVCLVPSAL
jgi:hypothetical protein